MLGGQNQQGRFGRTLRGFPVIDMCREVRSLLPQVSPQGEFGLARTGDQDGCRMFERGDNAREELGIGRVDMFSLADVLMVQALDRSMRMDNDLSLRGATQVEDIGLAVIDPYDGATAVRGLWHGRRVASGAMLHWEIDSRAI